MHSINWGIAQTPLSTNALTKLDVSSISGHTVAAQHSFQILGTISAELPRAHLSSEVFKRVKPYILAGPTFHHPGSVDVLIGASLFPHILTHETHSLGRDMPYVEGSHFGFVIMGQAPCATNTVPVTYFTSLHPTTTVHDLNFTLEQFRVQEELSSYNRQSTDELIWDKHSATHTSDVDGRYVVRMPFKNDYSPLGTSMTNVTNDQPQWSSSRFTWK